MPTDKCQPPPSGAPPNGRNPPSVIEEEAREQRTGETALATACRAARRQSRLSERRHVRAMACLYDRRRHLSLVLGCAVPIPRGQDVEFTRRIIRVLGHRLHYQVSSAHGEGRHRARLTRIALFGECLVLKCQLRDDLQQGRTAV